METLPKYFCIKRDPNNPLWDKYMKWYNKEAGGKDVNKASVYYGRDGSEYWNGFNFSYDIDHLENNPTLITLEEWNEAVYPEQDPNEKSFKIQLTYETIIRRSDGIEFKKDTINGETIEEVKKQISELRTKANKLQGLLKFHSKHF